MIAHEGMKYAFIETAAEREAIYIRKELLHMPRSQWTDDSVYQQYRFCNVHRCQDKTFRLLAHLGLTNVHSPWDMGVRCMLRWLASNPMLQYLIDNDVLASCNDYPALVDTMLDAYHSKGIKLATGSFIVKRYGDDREQMLTWCRRGQNFAEWLNNKPTCTTEYAVAWFKDHLPWCADFTAYCVVSDFIYLCPEKFTDLYAWAATGPGSLRGLSYIYKDFRPKQFKQACTDLLEYWESVDYASMVCTRAGVTEEDVKEMEKELGLFPSTQYWHPPLMLDVEHWLCEFAKHTRGYSRSKY